MDDIIEELSELCFDLGDSLRHEKDEDKKKKMLARYLEKVTTMNKDSKCKIPDFLPGLEWINVREPLSIYRHLQGKIVILDFFTYCCINCMHVLPDLKKLEQQFPIEDGLVIIGVHSAKFTNERVTQNILSAVKRYEIKHAVVNDKKEAMWQALSVHCWPTLYIIGPSGEPLLFLQGEGHYDTLRLFISLALAHYNSKGQLTLNKLGIIDTEGDSIVQSDINNSILHYPGKVVISRCGTLMAIADSAHHRITVADLKSGHILHEIGGPTSGLADGNFTAAKFFSPQGLAFFDRNILLVADTENHCIREVDLTGEKVKTIVGDGRQGRDYQGGKSGLLQQISSPWDLCIPGGDLDWKVCFIAMAGTHQLWAYFLEDTLLWKRAHKKGSCVAVVGSGREENRNNHYPMSAGLAQPSGLTYGPPNNVQQAGCIYVADSESSTIRQIDLQSGRVLGLVGGGVDVRNLFAYGDIDGIGLDVKLQHPLGVTYCSHDEKLYVADTYNHKIKVIEPLKKSCTTLKIDQKLKLNEPGGLYAHEDEIYIADTNNHCIKVLNLKDNSLSKFELESKQLNMEKHGSGSVKRKFTNETVAKMNSKGGELHVSINLELPSGTSLTKDGPSKWTVMMNDDHRLLNTGGEFTLTPKWKIPVKKEECETVAINGRVFVCMEDVCSVREVNMLVKLEYTDNGPTSAQCKLQATL